MKIYHNTMIDENGGFNNLIHNISMNEYLSDHTKNVVFRELDDISESIASAKEHEMIDLSKLQKMISIMIEESQMSILENIAFTKMFITQDVNVHDLSISESVNVADDKKIDDRVPIFFIFNGGDNMLSRTIMMFTKAEFSHASISTSGLDAITSFATTKQNYGLVVENWFDFCNIRKPKNIAVHFTDVSLEDYSKIKTTLEFHKAHNNDYYYSFKKLFTAPFRAMYKTKDEPNGFVCSEFINYIITGTSINESTIEKEDYFITPEDFRKRILKRSNTVYSGSIDNFNPSIVKNVYNLYTSSIISKKKAIDAKIEKAFTKDIDAETKKKIKQFKLNINK